MEVLVAALVLVVGLLGVVSLVDAANGTTRTTLARERGTTLAREILERARQVPFDAQGAASFGATVRASLSDAPNAVALTGSSFTLARRGVTYTAAVTACKVDDPTDGVGVHDATFCDFGDPAGGGTPAPGAPAGAAVTLKLLGLAIAAPVGGALVDSTVCGLLGANPVGSVPLLDTLLGRGGTASTALALVDSGADLTLCPASATGEQFALDRTPGDFSKVVATVTWPAPNGRTGRVVQSTLIANPGNA